MVHHLSYSSISKYRQCPRAWRYRYIDKVKVPTSVNLFFGSAIHSVIEDKICGSDKSLPELWDINWQIQLQKNPSKNWLDKEPSYYETLGKYMMQSETVTDVVNGFSPMIDADGHAVEKKIELLVDDVSVPIIGYVDIIHENGIPGDFKTAAKAWPANRGITETQPLIYLAALKQMGFECPGNRFYHHIFVKTRTSQAQLIETVYPNQLIEWGLEQVRQVWYGIRSSAFPACAGGWWCSSKWCEYHDICKPT
jgi:hypothetical protein